MYTRSIIFDKDHEIAENDAVYAEHWDGEFKIRFKDTEEGRKAEKMYEQLCSEVKDE